MSSGKNANNAPSDRQMTKMAGPWQPLQQPIINQVKKIGQQIAGTDDTYQYGPDRYAGLNPTQTGALNTGIGMANAGNPALPGALNFAGGVAGGNQVGTAAGTGAVENVANSGVVSPAYAQLQQALGMAGNAGSDLDYLRKTAAGGNLQGNPYLDQVIANASKDTTNALLPQLEGRMVAGGRLGSGAEGVGQGEIARQINQNATATRYGDYATERGYQNQAGLALPGADQQVIAGLRDTAGATNADAYKRIQMQLDAAGQAHDQRNSDTAMALNAGNNAIADYAGQFAGVDKALQYGGMQQQDQQAQQSEAADKFNFNQNANYDRIQRALGLYNQAGTGTNSGAANAAYADSLNRPSTFQQATGNVLAGAGTAASIFAPYASGPTRQVLQNFGQVQRAA